MADLVQHAARLGRVLDVDGVADPAQAERAQRVELALVGAVLGLELRDPHASVVSSAAAAASGSGAAAASASGAAAAAGSAAASTTSASTPASASVPAMTSAAASSCLPLRPSTVLIDS